MRSVISLLFVAIPLMLIGCGSTKSLQATDTGDVPDWFTNVPKDPNVLYAAKKPLHKTCNLLLIRHPQMHAQKLDDKWK
jgi:hypothetical protein